MDKGKSTMTGVEEYNNSCVKRHKSQTTPQRRQLLTHPIKAEPPIHCYSTTKMVRLLFFHILWLRCTGKIHIADLSGPLMVNIFPQDIAYLLEINYSSFFDYLSKGIDVRQLFEHLEGQNMLLYVQPIKTKEGTSWVAQQVLNIPIGEVEKEIFKTKTDVTASSQCDLDDGMNNLFPEIGQGDYPVYRRYGEEDVKIILDEDP